MEAYYPNKLATYFSKDLFVYANVPYRIKPYESILKDPKNTIDFDFEKEENIQFKRQEIGIDGALLRDTTVFIYKVNFIEKMLATVLAKVSNFIPEGGIWLNTQRPEWNDANNALVGNGVSMVTLYYLRRFLSFFKNVLEKNSSSSFEISTELFHFFEKLNTSFSALDLNLNHKDRKRFVDGIGEVAAEYRDRIYTSYFSGTKESLDKSRIIQFFEIAINFSLPLS